MITKFNTYIKESTEEISFEILLNLDSFYFNLSFIYNVISKTGSINYEIVDIVFDGYNDLNWNENKNKINNFIYERLYNIFRIDDLKHIKTDNFLLYRYLIISYNDKIDIGEINKFDDDTFENISFYIGPGSVNDLITKLSRTYQKYTYKYRDDIIYIVEDIIKNDINVFKDKYFVDIIINNEYLHNKYKHLIDASNFDLI